MNFNLKDTRAESTAIFATISHPTRWRYYIGVSISPKHWDKGRQRAKYNHPNHIHLNKLLDQVQTKAYDIYLEAVKEEKALTKAQIKNQLDILLLKKEDTSNKLMPFIDKYIQQSGMAKNTLQNYRVAKRHIESFNPDLTFEDITLDFFYSFRNHLSKYKQNTIQSTIKNLKVFMQDAFDRGLHSNEQFRHKKFSVSKEEVDRDYLTESELDKLFQRNFNYRLQKAVDRYLVKM